MSVDPTYNSGAATFRTRAVDASFNATMIAQLIASGFEGFSHESAMEKVSHQYLQNPSGPAECLLLEKDTTSQPAGMQVLLPRAFSVQGVPTSAALLADFLVLPEYRFLGPALQLARATLSHGSRTFELVYGFPNPKASLIFRRVGLEPAAQIVRFGKVLRSGRFLSARWTSRNRHTRALQLVSSRLADGILSFRAWVRVSRLRARWRWSILPEFNEQFDAIWQDAETRGLSIGRRDRAGLVWRFPSSSEQRISCAFDRSGTMMGYVVWRKDGCTTVLLDALCRDMEVNFQKLLAGFTYSQGAFDTDNVSAEFAGPPFVLSALKANGFVPRDAMPVNIKLSPLVAAGPIYLTGFDRDSI